MTGPGYRRTLVVTAVDAERAAIHEGLGTAAGPAAPGLGRAGPAVGPTWRDAGPAGAGAGAAADGVTVAVVGVGVAAAAAGTARLLALAEAAGRRYDAVLCAGIAGGFPDRVGIGGLVIAATSVAADLGAEAPDGFVPLDELGFGRAAAEADPALLASIVSALPGATIGAVLTVSTVTGTAGSAAALRGRYPDAVAEGMEGFGVAMAAAGAGVAFGELRAISNPVGPRDRASWQIPTALTALGTALASVDRALRRAA